MVELLNAYIAFEPKGKFKAMSYSKGKLKIAFEDHTDIVMKTEMGIAIIFE